MAMTKRDLDVKCILVKHSENAVFYNEVKLVLVGIEYGREFTQREHYKCTGYRQSPKMFWRIWKALRDTMLPIMCQHKRVGVMDEKGKTTGFQDDCSIRLMTTEEYTKYGSALGYRADCHRKAQHYGGH